MTSPDRIRVVAAVIRRGADYLICQRPSHKRHGGLWEFPGGKLETGETILDAARRELGEELGVTVERVSEVEFSVNDPGSNFVIEFHPVEITGEPKCLEHEQLAWLPPHELLQRNLAPSDLLFARHIANRSANGDPRS